MKLNTSYFLAAIILIAAYISTAGCEKLQLPDGDAGVLEGVITIGPLCPVVTDPPQPECLPTAQTYLDYPVSVYTLNGRIRIKKIYPALDGSYSTELPEGRYRIMLENGDFGPGWSNLPETVVIQPNDTTIFDIDIDTGIR